MPPPRQEEHLEWLVPMPPNHLDGAKWVIDGSLLDGPRRMTRRPGFALMLVSELGTPLALALGTPPSWIHTANGAGGWALLQVLRISVGAEAIYTDCRSLLATLHLGQEAATAANRSMARLWGMIFHCLDDSGAALLLQDADGLVWLPAHRPDAVLAGGCQTSSDHHRPFWITTTCFLRLRTICGPLRIILEK